MKKGITPIIAVIILLLITVALAGMAWTFLSGYFTGMTAQNIQLVDYSCSGGTARVIIRNAGTQTITMASPCNAGAPLTAVATCGSTGMTVVKNVDFVAAPTLTDVSVDKGEVTTFTETGLATGTYTYRFTTTTGAGGPSPNVATVTC
ncbi:MAG: hypothetical protein NTY20_01085 [Candidatus Aenigmarchaeota archaeon]|nr:hypothetical protein [Candidatus Aenigmarchaeota archaeon]